MRFKGRKILIALSVFFLISCSNSLVDFEPLATENRLSFCSSVPIQNYSSDSDALFYTINDKNSFDIIKEKHNLNHYCTNINEFDETFFLSNSLLMYLSYFVGDFVIGSELTNNLITYHFYHPEVEDQVFNYFCFTNIIQKEAVNINSFQFTVETHSLSYDDFIKIQNGKNLTKF
jgi:hypothetical protein